MNDKEKIKICKRKVIELNDKIKQHNAHKELLDNIVNELNARKNIKLSNALYGIDFKEDIGYLKDWIKFYKEQIVKYENKIRALGKKSLQIDEQKEEIREQVKELFVDKKVKLYKNKLVRYGLPILLSLLIITVLFISKPEIIGYTIFTKEKTNIDNLNLIINESGNYTWNVGKPGDIKSIIASGRVKGNGTAKIYIEKDGKRYLVYDKNQ